MGAVDAPPLDAETDAGDDPCARKLRVCVVGSGPRFLSGISYYTNRLITALARRHRVSAILIRQLLPTRLYPGKERVGDGLAQFTYPEGSRVFDGIDWWWGGSILRAIGLLVGEKPEVLVLQWWSGTVLHSYLLIAPIAKLLGARVVIEFHEVLDTAELEIAPARWYVHALLPLLLRLSDGFVVHSDFDRHALSERYRIAGKPTAQIPHGPYDQYEAEDVREPIAANGSGEEVCNLLYFGVIRPFKGVEDIVEAFDQLSDEEARGYRLRVVGETWEGWTLPSDRIASSRHGDRIEFINRYVEDAEVPHIFAAADAVVLPYHRSSSSGPLHLAMSFGLPVIVSNVGGLVEATNGYEGALKVPPKDPEAIRNAFARVGEMRGMRFADVHSWDTTLSGYEELFQQLVPEGARSL